MFTTESSLIRKAWDNIAVSFDRYVTPTANWALAKTALRLAGLKPGMHFPDVTSGSGAQSLPAARLGAKVLAVEFQQLRFFRSVFLKSFVCSPGWSGTTAHYDMHVHTGLRHEMSAGNSGFLSS